MTLEWNNITENAIGFAKKWENSDGREEASAQSFITDFLKVFGIYDPKTVGDFEYKVPLDDGTNGYFDYLWKNHIAIEMKSRGKNLKEAYAQIKNYLVHLPGKEMPDLVMVCDFDNFVLYRRTSGQSKSFKLPALKRNVKYFAEIAGYESTRYYDDQIEVNVAAAEKMARLHDALKSHGYEGHDLEVYLVRLLFCLFADNTEIFPPDAFLNYIENSRPDGSDLSARIGKLFELLDMDDARRRKNSLLSADLLQFPYINGGLFRGLLPSADFNAKMRETLLDCCLFDWNEISPAIFGAMFQGVMDKAERREFGAHYTSEENILKVINPLFMDALWEEFEKIKTDAKALDAFHTKIAGLKFLDPACGCGNFLVIAYRELRRLERAVLRMKVNSAQMLLDISPLLRVSINQFFGIEIEEFPAQIAQVAMWLMEYKMNLELEDEFGCHHLDIPLRNSATIINGNALRIDWNSVVPKQELSYIMGNPPFSGARIMTASQKNEIFDVFGKNPGIGNLDYVTAWYKKAAELIQNSDIFCGFVSTNSITQGEQVAILWKPLFENLNIHINFAYKTFKWSNEAKGKAAVHCVIVGFSQCSDKREKYIYFDNKNKIPAKNINPYLIDADNIFVESRTKPICDVPEMGIGNEPIDGGNYLFTKEEKAEFIKSEPQSEKWFRLWYGAFEFINNQPRYCLWLGDCKPNELRQMPLAMKRIEAVRNYRLASPSAGTRKIAEKPTRFHVENMPDSDFMIIPRVSSEKRKYVPIGFVNENVIASEAVQIIPNATIYHFGILTSSVHMAWMRTVCGRLKSDYRYSKDIVYNNFPWCSPSEAQKTKIEQTAQEILDARALYPDSSLADLYDPLTMPPELLRAHSANDRAVLSAYGFPADSSEDSIVAGLFRLYSEIVK